MVSSFDLAFLNILANGGNVRTQSVDEIVEDAAPAANIAHRQCQFCSDKFRTNFALNRHVSTKHPSKFRKCGQCSAKYITAVALKKHIAERHGPKTLSGRPSNTEFRCVFFKQCSFKCNETSALLQHMLSEHSVSGIKCDHCTFITVNKYCLKAHMLNKHTPASDIHWFECQECPYKFKTKSNLKKHFKSIHSSVVHWYHCSFCPFKTKYKYHQREHEVRKHENNKNIKFLKCEHCSYKTKNVTELKEHNLSIHIPVESNVGHHSKQGSSKTKRTGDLKHPDDGEIQWRHCAHCSYRCKTGDEMRKHSKGKHPNKSGLLNLFVCEQCSFKPKSKMLLQRHIMLKHTPEEEIQWFRCEHCSYKVMEKYRLKNHTLNNHVNDGDICWKYCKVCPYKAKTRKTLYNHISAKHVSKNNV